MDKFVEMMQSASDGDLNYRTWRDKKWSCSLTLNVDNLTAQISSDALTAEDAINGAYVKFCRVVKQLPELRPALTYEGTMADIYNATSLDDEIPF